MKILMLTASLRSGGAETHVFELARALSRRSHTLTLASAGGAIADRICREEQKIRHLCLPLDSKKPSDLIFSVTRLRKLIKKERFDVIHLHSRIAALVCALAISGMKHPPLTVSTVHARFRVSPILRRLSFWGERAIAVSDDLKKYLCDSYSIPKDRVSVIPNAIDTERFSPLTASAPQSEHFSADKPPRIVFVSRLGTDCSLGALLLCRAAERLAKKFPRVKIEIVGGGKEYKKLSSLAQSINGRLGYECITLCGFALDVERILREADVFVGVSRAALEAMSSALPVILCGNEGYLGILDSSNIELAARSNFCCRGASLPTSDELFDSLCLLLEMKRSERLALGRYLREHVLCHHGVSSLAERTEDFYRAALLSRPRRIVLCGYYGSGNLGDDALLECAIEQVKKEEAGCELCVISHAPKRIAKKHAVRAVDKLSPIALRRELSKADRVIFGGGSILQNATSMRSLRYYTSVITYASRCGASVELLSNGLGPLSTPSAERLAAKALARCSRLSFRDPASASLARRLVGKEKKIYTEDDLSAALKPCDEEHARNILASAGVPKDAPLLLIAPRKRSDKKTRKRLEDEIVAHKRGGLFPLFIVMHKKEDLRLCRRLAKKYGGALLYDISPRELAAIVPLSQFAIGERYHLLYLCSRAGVPTAAFGSDPKLLSLSALSHEVSTQKRD